MLWKQKVLSHISAVQQFYSCGCTFLELKCQIQFIIEIMYVIWLISQLISIYIKACNHCGKSIMEGVINFTGEALWFYLYQTAAAHEPHMIHKLASISCEMSKNRTGKVLGWICILIQKIWPKLVYFFYIS